MSKNNKEQTTGRNIYEEKVRVKSLRLLGADMALLRLEAPDIAQTIKPGQFVMLACTGNEQDPLLLRPFAVSGVSDAELEILFQIVGRGTRLLASVRPEEYLKLRGPFGNGFSEPKRSRILLASGGAGVAPMMLTFERYRAMASDMQFAFGVPGKGWEELAAFVSKQVPEARIFSDDGSIGTKGTACDAIDDSFDELWVCGPHAMLAAFVQKASPSQGILVSMDSRMGCGYGGCMCCTLPTNKGRLRVCTEGPIFDGRELKWNDLLTKTKDGTKCSCA